MNERYVPPRWIGPRIEHRGWDVDLTSSAVEKIGDKQLSGLHEHGESSVPIGGVGDDAPTRLPGALPPRPFLRREVLIFRTTDVCRLEDEPFAPVLDT